MKKEEELVILKEDSIGKKIWNWCKAKNLLLRSHGCGLWSGEIYENLQEEDEVLWWKKHHRILWITAGGQAAMRERDLGDT